MKKTNYFDRKIYERDKKIKIFFVILITFLIGMYVGLAINYLELQEKDAKITEKYIEIDSLKETIDIQQQEIQKLETRLNDYTIKERRQEI